VHPTANVALGGDLIRLGLSCEGGGHDL
jgi:hypothetical protein